MCLSSLQELELSKDGKGYRTVSRCPIHFVLTHDNKGFEGLHLHEHEGHRYMMGLCEGEWHGVRHMPGLEDHTLLPGILPNPACSANPISAYTL